VWDPNAFPTVWPLGVDLTAGGFGIESMHMLPFVPLLASSCDVVLNGLAGDCILGGNFMKHSWLAERDITRLGRAVWRWRVSESQDGLVDQLTARKAGDTTASERWATSIAAREGARPIERVNDWLYENRIFRYTNSGTMLLRTGVESHAPFFDRDFIDSVIAVRQEHKFKHRLYLEVMKRVAPRSASVTWQRTNIPPGWGYRANFAAMAFQRVATKICTPLGIDPFKSLTVADPPGWLRGSWQPHVNNILMSNQARHRGLVDQDSVQKIWTAHLDGGNYTRQLGALTAVELFARQVIDGEAP
jgi:asparagine synthetase B (glutamine-hydrolysing)